jgi:hypothetical protein
MEIETHEWKAILQKYPHILVMGIQSSLLPKIELLESVVGKNTASKYIQNSPISLLTIIMEKFRARIQSVEYSSTNSMPVIARSFDNLSSKNNRGRTRRSRKTIQVLVKNANNKTVVETRVSICGKSRNVCRDLQGKKCTINGRKYVFADKHDDDDAILLGNQSAPTITPEDSGKMSQFTIHSSERDYPPEDTVRGRRRAGGMTLQIHNWTSTHWKKSCSNLWKGMRFRLLSDEQNLIIGCHYLRPSRRLCSLYAAFQALRVAREWYKRISSPSAVICIA